MTFKKGMIPWNKNVPMNQLTRKKLSNLTKKLWKNNEYRTKVLKRRKEVGQRIWNKGMKGIHLSPKTEFKKGIISWMKGKKHTKETKLKISKVLTGRTPTFETRKKLSEAKMGHIVLQSTREKIQQKLMGHEVTLETRDKISVTSKQVWNDDEYHNKMSGKNSHMWKGGKTLEPYGFEFTTKLKDLVKIRDCYTCQQCFVHDSESNTNLVIHHVDVNKLNNDISNLISVCKYCHGKIHGGEVLA